MDGAIPELLRAGHTIRLLSRHADHDTPAYPAGVEAFPADVNGPETLAGAVEGCDVVLHVVGIVEDQPPEITFERANVEGTRNMLAAAASAGHPRFIYRSKRAAEALVQLYAGPWLILREILELAGPDLATTEDIFSRLATITGRNPPRLSIPA